MRIFIDAINLNYFKNTGPGNYTFEMLNKLLEIFPQPNYDILCDKSGNNFEFKNMDRVNFINMPVDRKHNDFSLLEKHIRDNNIDIYHSVNNGLSIPNHKYCNFVSTIYSLLPATNSKYCDEKYLKNFNLKFQNTIKNSSKIIVLSKCLKEDLCNHYDIPEKRISVVYPGFPSFSIDSTLPWNNTLENKYKIHSRYILFSGNLHPVKNLENLIRAFKKVWEETDNIKLVITGSIEGKKKAYYEKLINLCKELKISSHVIFTGLVDYKEMPYLYNNAECFVNLSRYEGFPLSTLEAMYFSTPVICNNRSFFRELVNNSSVLVDGNDYNIVAEKILEIINNSDLRTNIIKRQNKICENYTWDKAAQKIIHIYETLI